MSHWSWQAFESILPRFRNLTHLNIEIELENEPHVDATIMNTITTDLGKSISSAFRNPRMYPFIHGFRTMLIGKLITAVIGLTVKNLGMYKWLEDEDDDDDDDYDGL